MTVEEIFDTLINHMKEGMEFHAELARGYDFIGLYGFTKCHEYHYLAETKGYESLLHYYSTRYHKLINISEVPKHNLIPEAWYKYTTMAVDSGTIRTAVKSMMEKWVEWEKQTKKLYQKMYKELYDLGEIASAREIKCYIDDVDDELKHAEKKLIKLIAIDFDIVIITEWQQPMYRKFKKRLKHIYD